MAKKSQALQRAEEHAARAEGEAIYYARILGATLTGTSKTTWSGPTKGPREWRIVYAPSLRNSEEYTLGTLAIFDLTRSVDGGHPNLVGASYIGSVEEVNTAVWAIRSRSSDHSLHRLSDVLFKFEQDFRLRRAA